METPGKQKPVAVALEPGSTEAETTEVDATTTTTTTVSRFRPMVYFVNWGIYGRNYHAYNLPASRLNYVIYAFANIRPDTGEVYLSDTWADIQKHYPADSWNEPGNNVYGCVKQLFLLKKKYRHLKVLLSIGGWTYSSNFAQPASTEAGRSTFAKTATRLVLDLGMDGLDIDWEYPKDDTEAKNFVLLLKAVRTAMNQAEKPDRQFRMTIACPAGPDNIKKLRLPEMTPYLDFYNLMAYDYSGSWDTVAGHQANIKPSVTNAKATPFSTSAALDYYINVGKVPPQKMVLGMPLYGRVFANTDGPGTSFQGNGGEGSFEPGIWDYKALPKPGAQQFKDSISQNGCGASWSYDSARRTMVTYDTVGMVVEKTNYLMQRKLGGGMWWEASGDKGDTNARKADGSLIGTFVETVNASGNAMSRVPNALNYPESQYDNLRAKFPGQ